MKLGIPLRPACASRGGRPRSRKRDGVRRDELNGGHVILSRWVLSSSSDRRALDVVDGSGLFVGEGPHYSRRSPGSKTFTGVGQEIVLVTSCGRAVWACVYQRTPSARGTGGSRGRVGVPDAKPRYLWRNMMFRNLGAGLSSDLIADALEATHLHWRERYHSIPAERLRTEIGCKEVKSSNPGYCYERAGWEYERDASGRRVERNGKLFLFAPALGAATVGFSLPSVTHGA
jgi:hypothetical protein